MKRLFFIISALSAVFSAIAQDPLEQRFNLAFHKLKRTLHIKSLKRELELLKNALASKQALAGNTKALVHAIANEPDIAQYLNRPADCVRLDALYNPQLTDKKELAMYTMLDSCVAYRSFIKQGSFFKRFSGSVGAVQFYTKSLLQEQCARDAAYARNAVHLNVEGGNCYYLGQNISATQATITNAQCHVRMHDQGGHHILSITIYDPIMVPVTFIIDTHNGGSYIIAGDYITVQAPFQLQNLGPQTEQSPVSDYNCYLYTYELTKSALQYLQQHNLTDLKQACMCADYKRATEILHCGMQQYLPYYQLSNGQYVRKSRAEIDTYNRNLRWQLSGEIFLSELKKLAQDKKTA